MNTKNITLTPVDKEILRSYKEMMDGMASYLGSGFEIVLHSLEDLDTSVVKIINGFHTARKEGAPITDFALSMLNKIEDEYIEGYACYESSHKFGKDFRSTTILIYGEAHRLIGFLCINFDLNTPVSKAFPIFTIANKSKMDQVQENFANDVDSLIEVAVNEVREKVERDLSIPASLKKKEIVQCLDSQGVFKIKDSVIKVASLLDLSKNTIYMHLRNFKNKEE